MDNEVIFISIIAFLAFGFCVVNAVSFFMFKNHSKKAQGTIISFKTLNPLTEKMRNSKWATVTYNVAGKNYISQNQIQVSMTADIGSHVQVRYNIDQPDKLYHFSVKRIVVSALVVVACLVAISLKTMC